jgi:hypothetical protein
VPASAPHCQIVGPMNPMAREVRIALGDLVHVGPQAPGDVGGRVAWMRLHANAGGAARAARTHERGVVLGVEWLPLALLRTPGARSRLGGLLLPRFTALSVLCPSRAGVAVVSTSGSAALAEQGCSDRMLPLADLLVRVLGQ